MESQVKKLFLTPREQQSNFGFALWQAPPELMPDSHTHNDVEVNYLERGVVTYLIGGKKVLIREGQLVIFWAGRTHQVINVSPEVYTYGLSIPLSWFLNWHLPSFFNQAILRGEMLFPPLNHHVLRYKDQIEDWVEDLIEDSTERRRVLLVEIEGWFRRVALAMRPVLSTVVIHGLQQDQAAGSNLIKVEKMAQYINEHYMEPINTSEVAREVGLHPNYAVQLFHKTTGSTLVDFIIKQRLAHAQMQLATTDDQVLDIAMDAGFGSASRFYSVFKKMCGMSPNDYRKMINRPRP